MEVSKIRRALLVCAAAMAAVGVSLLSAAPSLAVTVSPVVKGLDQPRALSFDSEGTLFVAEAGHGGNECFKGGPTGEICVGFTSGVSKIEKGVAKRVVDGYVSAALQRDGSVAVGIDGISVRNDWRIFAVVGESQFAVPPTGFSKATTEKAKAQLGRLDEFTPGKARVLADVGGFDFKWGEEPEHKKKNPQFPDANPYAVLATDDGEWVVDAAANTLDWVSKSGAVKVVAFFPGPKAPEPLPDAVPTCIAKGPDGALYVSELTGFGAGPGASVVWRVEPGEQPTIWAKGLSGVTGCGFDSEGNFFATEFSLEGFNPEKFKPEGGALVRVPPHSTSPITVVPKLSFPNGFASRGDDIFVSNWSTSPASAPHSGEVLEIEH